jgi:hypothetical protein
LECLRGIAQVSRNLWQRDHNDVLIERHEQHRTREQYEDHLALRPSGVSLARASRLARLSRLADVEACDQAILDPKDVTDRLVNQHRSLEVAHGLVDLDDDLTVGAG